MVEPRPDNRWRGKPIELHDYDDVASAVHVARRARSRIVEFDWSVDRAELGALQRAVFEWGTASIRPFQERFEAL